MYRKSLRATTVCGLLAAAALVGPPQGPAAQVAAPPLYLVLMVDVSDSLTMGMVGFLGADRSDRTYISEASRGLAAAVGPEDAVVLGSFGKSVRYSKAAVRGREQIERAASVLAQDFGGPSPLWDAMDLAIGAVGSANGPRAIIVLTDGRTNANTKSFAQVLGRLEHSGIRVFIVAPFSSAFDTQSGRARARGSMLSTAPDPSVRLRMLADTTGGRFYTFKQREELGPLLQNVVDALRQSK